MHTVTLQFFTLNCYWIKWDVHIWKRSTRLGVVQSCDSRPLQHPYVPLLLNRQVWDNVSLPCVSFIILHSLYERSRTYTWKHWKWDLHIWKRSTRMELSGAVKARFTRWYYIVSHLAYLKKMGHTHRSCQHVDVRRGYTRWTYIVPYLAYLKMWCVHIWK